MAQVIPSSSHVFPYDAPREWTGQAHDTAAHFRFDTLPWLSFDTVGAEQRGIRCVKACKSRRVFRLDLKDLGEHLDMGETGLIVVAAVDLSERVEAAITRATYVTKKELQASYDDLAQELGEAEGGGG